MYKKNQHNSTLIQQHDRVWSNSIAIFHNLSFFPFQHFHHSQHTTHKTPAVLLPIVILSLQLPSLPSIHILPMWINKYMIFKEEIFTTSHYNRKITWHEAQCRYFWIFLMNWEVCDARFVGVK